MIDILKFRLGYGRQTVAFPDGPAKFPTGWFETEGRMYAWLTS